MFLSVITEKLALKVVQSADDALIESLGRVFEEDLTASTSHP